MSASVADSPTFSAAPSFTSCAPIAASTGACGTSLTVSVNVSESVSVPSDTVTIIEKDPESANPGAKSRSAVPSPLFVSVPNPGSPVVLNTSDANGVSASVADSPTFSAAPSSTTWLPIGGRTGEDPAGTLLKLVTSN